MEHKIGEIITMSDGTKAVCEESELMLQCSRCALWLTKDCHDGLVCDSTARSDHKNVIYKEIEEE